MANDFDRGNCMGNCLDFWNLGSCAGPSKGVENTVTYYMYKVIRDTGIYSSAASANSVAYSHYAEVFKLCWG